MRRADVFGLLPDAWLPGVVRLARGAKTPIDRGFNSEAARRWTEGAPAEWRATIVRHLETGGNVGMVPPPGVVVIDCDNQTAVDFIRGYALVDTPWVRRTESSAHFWFRYQLPAAAREWLSKGTTLDNGAAFDLRVSGKSQAAIPPTLHASGIHAAWIVPLPDHPDLVPPMPRELQKILIDAGLTYLRDYEGASVPTGENAHDTVRDWIMAHVDSVETEAELYELSERYARSYVEPMRPARFYEMLESNELRDLVRGAWERRGRNELPRLSRVGAGDDRHVYFWKEFFPEKWAYVGEWSALGSWTAWNGTTWEHRPEYGNDGFLGALQRFSTRLRQLRDRDDPSQPDHGAWCLLIDNLRNELARTRTSAGPIARLTQHLAMSSTSFDQKPELWVCPARGELQPVTFDFMRQERFAPRPEDYLTQHCGAAFDPNFVSPEWEQFLVDAFPDPGLRTYIQTAVGYSLLGMPNEDVVFFLIGRGGSGKGTFMSALESTFGQYAGVVPPADIDDKMPGASAGGTNASLLTLRGKRIVTCTELSDRVRLGAKLKALSGGDLVNARGLYAKTTTTYQPRFVIWLGGNFQPEAKAVDTGLTRRMRYIPMEETPRKRDPMLRHRFKHDPLIHTAVLNWALQGLRRYLTQGLITPEIVERRSLRARVEASDIGPWLHDWVIADPTARGFTPGEGYDSYVQWFIETHNSRRGIPVKNVARFGEEMAALAHKAVRAREGTGQIRVYKGLRIMSYKERVARDNGQL